MTGAIIGDIVGSAYEWYGVKTEDFILFKNESTFTDDSVLTCATAYSILNNIPFVDAYVSFYKKYPESGYGGKFVQWAKSGDLKPYNSFGNGSAMRVAPVAYACSSLDEVLNLAKKSAECTHNHIEGIKGAQATAAAIYMAKEGYSKKDIKNYIENTFKYNLNKKIEKIRPSYIFDSTCQGSVPEAIMCFLQSESFEDTIRKAVSLGGDADTQACIAGGIAEAFYKNVPKDMKIEMNKRLPKDLKDITEEFVTKYNIAS